MQDVTMKGLMLSGFAYAGSVGGRAAGTNVAMRSARTRRKMAEKDRRAAVKAFAAKIGITVPAALDGRPYMDGDFEAVAALIDANPCLKSLLDQFCEIDEFWRLD